MCFFLKQTTILFNFSGLYDKYDPFMSAKRQLEDLFSPPPAMITSTPISEHKSMAPSKMSSSLTTAKSPTSPTRNSNLSKSSFRRTSSLRVPKKTSPVSYMPKYRPTIQRGISDEGPISSNFMKSEEYDELPVKSHAIIPPDLVPKSPKTPIREVPAASPIVIKRQQSASGNRRGVADFQLTKTDSLAAFLKFENDLEHTAQSIDDKFLLSLKELKDKSNSLNKKSFAELIDNKVNDSSNEFGSGINEEIVTPRMECNLFKLAPIDKPLVKHKITLEPLLSNRECNNNHIRIEDNDNTIDSNLINSCDNLKISHISKLPTNESNSFDLTNDLKCEEVTDESLENNIVTNTSNLSNSLTRNSSSAESINSHQNIELIVNLKNISDSDKRNPKRSIQLRKDNLLFASGTIGIDDKNDQNQNISNRQNGEKEKQNDAELPKIDRSSSFNRKVSTQNNQNIEALFDDFDLEEFISTFSDNEQFPIFKNYKEMKSDIGRHPHSSESASEESEFDDKIETNGKHDNEPVKELTEENFLKKPDVTAEAEKRLQIEANHQFDKKSEEIKPKSHLKLCSMQDLFGDDDFDDGMTQAERELLESVQELNRMCDDSKTLDLTAGLATLNEKYPAEKESMSYR